jgi:hypothetical protein
VLTFPRQHRCDAPTRIPVRWQHRTSFHKAAELEIRRVCPFKVAQGHTPGGRIDLGRHSVGANAEQRGTRGARIDRLRGGASLAHRSAGPRWTASGGLPVVRRPPGRTWLRNMRSRVYQESLFGESNTAAPEADRTVSTKLAGLVARARKEARLTDVVQYVDEELLRLAFRSLHKQAAPGVDGQSYEGYGAGLGYWVR